MPEASEKPKNNNKLLALSPPPAIRLKLRRQLIILAHIFIFAVALLLSFLMASNMQFKSSWLAEQYPLLLAFFIIIKLPIFGFSKQYRGWWRYVGITDLIGIAAASLISTFIIVALWFAMLNSPLRQYPGVERLTEVGQSIFMLDMFFTVLLLSGLRMLIRLYYEEFRTIEGGRLKRFLIVGAGDAGEALLREIHRMHVTVYDVVGFVDDDPLKHRFNIHGIPVLGTVEQLPKICADNSIEEIAIAMPSASHQQLSLYIK